MGKKQGKSVLKRIFACIGLVAYILLFIFVSKKYLYSNRYIDINVPSELVLSASGKEQKTIEVELTNKMLYSISSNDHYFASYHILDESGKMLQFENDRTPLPKIEPGKTATIKLLIKKPQIDLKSYKIEIDILKENEFWFKTKGNNNTAICNITVK